ncbi:MAG: hypothetical protein WCA46_30495 [Actinocatenispora sp.]
MSKASVPLLVVGGLVGMIALIGMVVIVVDLAKGDDANHARPPQAHAPQRVVPVPHGPSRTAAAAYRTLPDPCALGDSTPKLADGIKADPGTPGDPKRRECQFGRYHSDQAANLEVTLTLNTGETGPSDAHRTLGDDKAYSADTEENGGYRKKPTALDGVGDEGWGCHLFNEIGHGDSEQTAKTYSMAGAIVEIRARNVVVEVDWAAATRYTSGGETLTGTYLPYDQARKQATAVAKYLVARLH